MGGNSSSTKARELARELAAKRRARRVEEPQSLAGVWVAAGMVALGAAAFVANSEDGERWLEKNVFQGTPLGEARRQVKELVGSSVKSFTDPISEQLLPDFPDSIPPEQRPRTLVIDFEDTICHLEWDRRNGWHVAKRPGVDAFMQRMSQFYELVLFTSGNQMFLEPFVLQLDPYQLLSHRLYRESTIYEDGEHVKDLSALNRPLHRVVAIDDKPVALSKQPDNLVQVKPFLNPREDDTVLQDLMPFLEDLVVRDVPDVRAEIRRYHGKDLVAAFKQEQRDVAARRAKESKGTLGSAIRSSIFGSSAGGGSGKSSLPSMPVPSAGFLGGEPQQQPGLEIPMTPIEAADKLPPQLATPAAKTDEVAPATKPSGSFWSSVVAK